MSLHKEDARSKKIIFVANCILNANNKVLEQARYPGMFSEVVKIIDENDFGIMQMPCPETLYMGNQRWWNSRNLYDNVGYRKHCRELCKQVVDYIENYRKVRYKVSAILTCDGSPSCGITCSSYCPDWGGRPKEIPRELVDKPGVFIEELLKEFKARKMKVPEIYGLAMDNHDKTNEEILDEFREYVKSL